MGPRLVCTHLARGTLGSWRSRTTQGWPRTICRVLALVLATSAWPMAWAAGGESQLLAVLRAWAQSDTSFAADVRVVETGGADRKRFAEDYDRYAEWVEATGQGRPEDSVRKWVRTLRDSYPEGTNYYRYLSRGSRFRTEDFGDRLPGPSSVPRGIEAYSGERSEHLSIPAKDWDPKALPGMVVSTESRSETAFEVARGQALLVGMALGRFDKVSRPARGMGQLHWGEFFQTVMDPAMTKELTLPHPQTKEEMPVLELASAPWKDSGMGLYRARVWLDRKRGHSLARLECWDLEPDLVRGGYQYLVDSVVDWSAPMALPNGTLFPTKATVRYFHRFWSPVPGEPIMDKWPRISNEMLVRHFEFSNVRVGEPLSDSQLAIAVPPGTNVIDNTAGYRYFAGSAGEQLQKSALTLRQSEPGGLPERRWIGWRMWLVGLAVLVILGGVGVAFLRRRRAGR